MSYLYPYGDTQQLNLAWFLAKFKELYEYVTQLDPGESVMESVLSRFTEQYDSTKNYIPGDYCIHDGYIYKANRSTAGAFDSTAWDPALPVNDVQGLRILLGGLSTDLDTLEQNAVTNTQYTPGAATADGLLRQTKNGTASTVMTVDKKPTANSQNPVKSGAVFSKLDDEAYVRGKTGVKNLIPFPYATQSGYSATGITYTVENDGGITINGTSTGWSYFTCVRKNFGSESFNSTSTTGNGTYKAILIGTESATNKVYLSYYQNSTSVQVTVAPNVTINNLTVYPMICYEEEINVTDFELYAKTNRKLTDELENVKDSLNAILSPELNYIAPSDTVINATINAGGYIRIGKLVIINIRLTLTGAGAYIGYFPKPIQNGANLVGIVGYDGQNERVAFGYMSPGGVLSIPAAYGSTGVLLISTVYLTVD